MKLLGICVGPDAGKISTVMPLQKARGRALALKQVRLGVPRASFLYNQCGASVFAYTAQFCQVTNKISAAADRVAKLVTNAPRYAVPDEVIFGLSNVTAGPPMRHLAPVARAAEVRVVAKSDIVHDECIRVEDALQEERGFVGQYVRDWVHSSIVFTLDRKYQECLDVPGIVSGKGNRNMQWRCYEILTAECGAKDVEAGLRRRMNHWQEKVGPGILDVDAALITCQRVAACKRSAGVDASWLRTICSAWTTTAR